jgi:hypothetical protein
VKFIPLPSLSGWHISDDADVAVLPFEVPEKETDLMAIPPDTFLTDEMIQREAIGLGGEVFLIGLFHLVHGREKNYPIIRSGIVAATLVAKRTSGMRTSFPLRIRARQPI